MPLKNRSPFGTTIDNTLLALIKEMSVNTRIPLSRLIDEAIEDLLKKYELKKEKK